MIFKNRQEAGMELAKRLEKYEGQDIVVLGLPRGGIIVAKEIAKQLNFELGMVLVRKIGHPLNPEFAIGAVAANGEVVGDLNELSNVDADWLKKKTKEEVQEIQRRHLLYLNGQEPVNISNRKVIIVDDGMATGWTLMAAIREVREQNPMELIVAVPVAPTEIAEKIKDFVDDLVVIEQTDFFLAIGDFYESFPQITDEEVVDSLKN